MQRVVVTWAWQTRRRRGLHVASMYVCIIGCACTGMAWSSVLRWSFVSDVSFVAADRLAVGRSCLVCACMGFGIRAGLV